MAPGRGNPEGYTCREVGLDGTGDDAGGRTLSGDNHVYADCTCQLGDTADRELNFLAGCHDEVTELVDYHHDVRHELMAVLGIQFTTSELGIIFLYVAYTGFLEQVIASVHELTERLEGLHNL